jgi:glycosyltransferase involved in cell wall biosynthesis
MHVHKHKVLLFIPNLQQGGAERQILELARNLPERFETTLCVWNDAVHYRELLAEGEPRHVLGVRRMSLAGLHALEDVLALERPEILHSYRDKANFWARLAVRRVPVPIVLTSVRSRAMRLLYLLSEWRLSRHSDRVLTNSEGVRRELTRWARVDASKIQVIHNFIDLERFQPPSERARTEARAHFALGPEDLMLVVPGRISLQKHQLGLMRSLAWLQGRGQLPAGVRIFLAGRERDRAYACLLRRQIDGLGLGPRIVHLGAVTDHDMPRLYHAADALILPSLWEGLPNVVLEGAACGLPAIVSHAANVDGLVVEGQSGFEVPTFDRIALGRAIARMIELGEDQRRRMGAFGRAHVAAKFGPERILAETVRLYDTLLAEKGLLS